MYARFFNTRVYVYNAYAYHTENLRERKARETAMEIYVQNKNMFYTTYVIRDDQKERAHESYRGVACAYTMYTCTEGGGLSIIIIIIIILCGYIQSVCCFFFFYSYCSSAFDVRLIRSTHSSTAHARGFFPHRSTYIHVIIM